MKNLLFMFLVFALASTFAIDYNYDTTTDANGKVDELQDFDGYNVRLISFKSDTAFTTATVSFNGTVYYQGVVNQSQSYSLGGKRATNLKIYAEGGPANKAVRMILTFSLTRTDAEFSFITTTDKQGCVVKSGKVAGESCQWNSFYTSHSYSYVNIFADEIPVFSGAVKADTVYDLAASVTKNWVILACGGPAEKKTQMIFQHQEEGMMTSDVRKGFTYPVEGTTNQNGDVSVPDQVIDTTDYNVQVNAFSTSMGFKKVMLVLDGKPILPKSGTSMLAGQMYIINVKLNPGAHTVGVIAEGGTPETKATFVFMCHE